MGTWKFPAIKEPPSTGIISGPGSGRVGSDLRTSKSRTLATIRVALIRTGV
jgi:hypothetical protein